MMKQGEELQKTSVKHSDSEVLKFKCNNHRKTMFGQTAGGAREFVLPNMEIENLSNVVIRIIP